MPKTPVGADLLETLKILTELVVQHVSHDLEETELYSRCPKRAKIHLVGLAILDVPLPVKEPVGNLVLAGVLKRHNDATIKETKKIYKSIM